MKIDLHVHSKYSKRPSEWILKTLGCPESFTEPRELYRIAMTKGMTHVTITDHNTIDGCLEIIDLPNTFISEEVTTYFPEDKCKLHVLVYDISERQHHDIQQVRSNVHDLVEYLRTSSINHSLAHPLYSINNKLSIDRVEQCALLFDTWELNGARSEEQNICVQNFLNRLTPDSCNHLNEKHGLKDVLDKPWIRFLTAGSDDHSSLTIARRYTEVNAADNIKRFFDLLKQNRGRVEGLGSIPKTLAHNIYSIAYQFYKSKFDIEKVLKNDVISQFLSRHLLNENKKPGFSARIGYYWNLRKVNKGESQEPNLLNLLRDETHKFIFMNDGLDSFSIQKGKNRIPSDQNWFKFVEHVSDKALLKFADDVVNDFLSANILNLFGSLGSAGSLYSTISPYFISYSIFSQDRIFCRSVDHEFGAQQKNGEPNVAHFTDTLFEINGIARTLKRQLAAAKRLNKKYTIVTCGKNCADETIGIRCFKPSGVYELPIYPEQKFLFPPFLRMLDYCYESEFTHIHAATPGPLGIAALAIARILKIPIIGTYHTALPQYADYLIEDSSVTELVWHYIVWFYGQMDTIYVPSTATGEELISRGINPARLAVMKRGVDVQQFHPSKCIDLSGKFGIREDFIKLLYVGRVSREKNLELLSESFKRLSSVHQSVHLIVVGDGPYLETMKHGLKNYNVTFTGYLQGEELCQVYASSDLFIFPSTTDTFGNVVLEAQASGLPVIVTDCGGPKENVVDGITGVIVKTTTAEEFTKGISKVVNDKNKMRKMGQAARKQMENRAFEELFKITWQESYNGEVQPLNKRTA